MDITFDGRDVIRFAHALNRASRRGLEFAGAETANGMATETKKAWVKEAEDAFEIRNRWTIGSMKINRARVRGGARIESVLGSLSPYMKTQEEGGRHRDPIPTKVASGEGRGAGPRKRVVRRPNRMPRIKLTARQGANPRQRNAIAISMALRERRRFVFLELGRRKGIFRLAGGRRRTRLEMIWDLSRRNVRVPASHTLQKALHRASPKFNDLAVRALLKQMRRNGVIA